MMSHHDVRDGDSGSKEEGKECCKSHLIIDAKWQVLQVIKLYYVTVNVNLNELSFERKKLFSPFLDDLPNRGPDGQWSVHTILVHERGFYLPTLCFFL